MNIFKELLKTIGYESDFDRVLRIELHGPKDLDDQLFMGSTEYLLIKIDFDFKDRLWEIKNGYREE